MANHALLAGINQYKNAGVSKRQVMRETGIHWETLKNILAFGSPPGYRLAKPRPEPKIGPFLDRLTHRIYIIEANGESYRMRESPRKSKKVRRK